MKLRTSSLILPLIGMLFTQINVTVNQTIREVPLFGIANSSMRYNNYNGSGIEYDFGEIDFEKATRCINPHVMTFPAANPCYFDWADGWALDSAEIVNYVNTLTYLTQIITVLIQMVNIFLKYQTKITNGGKTRMELGIVPT